MKHFRRRESNMPSPGGRVRRDPVCDDLPQEWDPVEGPDHCRPPLLTDPTAPAGSQDAGDGGWEGR
jgi:hypothetical protein